MNDNARGVGPRRALSRINVVVAALLGFLTGGVALVFQLAPGLKPDPRDRVGADVAIFALEPSVTIGEWIERKFPAAGALEDQHPDRQAPGELLYVRTTVDGHKHRDVSLRFNVFSARTHRLIPPERIDAPPISTLNLSAPSERSVHVVWVPDLTLFAQDVFIRVELWDDKGILAVEDSPRIRKGRFVAN